MANLFTTHSLASLHASVHASHLNTNKVLICSMHLSAKFMILLSIIGSDVLKCPITCEVFKDPVVAAGMCGHAEKQLL